MDCNDHMHIQMVLMCWFLLITLPLSHSEPPTPTPPLPSEYSICKEKPYKCGTLSEKFYPFWGHDRPPQCGGGDTFKLSCQSDGTTTILIGSQNFTVKDIDDSTRHTMRLLPTNLGRDLCSLPTEATYVESTPLLYLESSLNSNITIFSRCSSLPEYLSQYNFTCGYNYSYYVSDEEYGTLINRHCDRHLRVPIDADYKVDGKADIEKVVLEKGFVVNYNVSPDCIKCLGKGDCWKDDFDKHVISCHYCSDGSDSSLCHKNNGLNWWRKIIIGVVSSVVGGALVGIGIYFFVRRRKNRQAMSYIQSRSLSSDPSSKNTEKGIQSFTQSFVPGVHLFSYDELEEATNYFDSSKELGEGGFGTVYFGKLRDGRSVAVKRLYENNYKRVAQFMNEIKILARLVHPNLVTLYGCTSRHSRELLLVYEYIPNGTVADHLHGQRSKPGKLPWHIRMNIAVETASALKFLHLKDIIHRDVKTNNILLDSNFRVKVADFGLSRLFPDHVTHVSTAPQGTPGYVDPEYHECYQLTNKSDVYSFGVVLVELISSLPAVDITRHRHEINLANMAINKIHSQALHELVDPTLGFESDFKVRKMINAVAELAFQCLQSSKEMRPSMEEVVETLKDIQSDDKHKSQPEVMDISSTADDVVLLKDDPPPPSPDSNVVSKSTTPNASG